MAIKKVKEEETITPEDIDSFYQDFLSRQFRRVNRLRKGWRGRPYYGSVVKRKK